MISIDNKDALGYCGAGSNILNAILSFLYVFGTGYATPPAVTFTGGGGTGAAGTAVLQNGKVVGITITAPGTGYTTAPTVVIAGAGGAAATATTDGAGVDSITVTDSGTGKKLTVTDLTTYPAGDSRSNVNITVADKFGNEVEKQIGVSPANTVIDVVLEGLNPVDGLDVLVTVVSVLGANKDGSAYNIGEGKTAGNFTMEV